MVLGILTKEAIEEAEKKGKLGFRYRKKLSSNNLNLRVKKLFRQKNIYNLGNYNHIIYYS